MKEYLAHRSEDGMREQTVREHLEGTADLAANFAAKFDNEQWGYGLGILHDVGKYSQPFQRRLDGGPKVDHSTAGAKEFGKINNLFGAYCVAGHHAGLPNGGRIGDASLQSRLDKNVEAYGDFLKEITIPTFPAPHLRPIKEHPGFSISFFIRMLFSCLVDADYLDTESFMKNGQVERNSGASMTLLLDKIEDYIAPWLQNTDRTTINGCRTEILKACLEKGEKKQGMYQLTVPTGGGKTIASLTFALRHCVKHNLDRVIYVIPYSSIIEQNSEVFRQVLGDENVLENHHDISFEDEDEEKLYRLAAENFDKPVVVTTNVQFFESLFSNKPSKCRKLHNFAKSVIVFDEAQMLPVEYLKPCIEAISELVYNYHCTAILCTATQPPLKKYFPKEISDKIEEICPNVEDQYEFFRRSKLENLGIISEEALVEQLKDKKQALCILNTKKSVQQVYEQLVVEKCEGLYHLSTLMYPAHRKRIINEIKNRLNGGMPCVVIATSLIEAGVDMDFPLVFRELAGIDSVLQAAGRCNREGKRSLEESVTYFFTLEKPRTSVDMRQSVEAAQYVVSKFDDVAELKAIQEYFNFLYLIKGEGLDKKKILQDFEETARSQNYPFADVASKFHLIEENTKAVLIPKEQEAKEIANGLVYGQPSRALMRKAGKYSVNLHEYQYEELVKAGMINVLYENFGILDDAFLDQYNETCGLMAKVELGGGIIFDS